MSLHPNPLFVLSAPQKRSRYAYQILKCSSHAEHKAFLRMPPHQFIISEIKQYPDDDRSEEILYRSYSFTSVIHRTGESLADPFIFAPVGIYVKKDYIRVELVPAFCACHHIFTVNKNDFYNVIRDTKIRCLDVHVDQDAKDLFEFIVFTLPGSWCRELKTLNIVFHGDFFMEQYSTLIKKSRGLSRLRICQNSSEVILASTLIKNMGSLEELELNSPIGNTGGYILDKAALDHIVKLDTQNGAKKPFRLLRVYNTTIGCTPEEFREACASLSELPHNRTYAGYSSINMMDYYHVDWKATGASIAFELNPIKDYEKRDELFDQMGFYSYDCRGYGESGPIYRLFLLGQMLFRFYDQSSIHR